VSAPPFRSQALHRQSTSRRLGSQGFCEALHLSLRSLPRSTGSFRLFVCVVHLGTNVDLVLITGAETGVNVADMAEAAAIVKLVA